MLRISERVLGPSVFGVRRSSGFAVAVMLVVFAVAIPVQAGDRAPLSIGRAARNASVKRLEIVQKELSESQKRHSARLEALAQEFTDNGLTAEADQCRALAAPMATTLFRVKKLPTEAEPEISHDLPEKERALKVMLRKREADYAAELYALSRKALYAGYPSFAYQIVQEIVRHNPDHASARRILGYKLRARQWVTPFTADKLDNGYVWDETYGWLKKEHVARYRAGKRLYRQWMSADKEAEIRRDFRHAWEVKTDHYIVRTNVSLERGVEIAKALEQYHDFFMQTFAAFFSRPEQMVKLFESSGKGSSALTHRHPYVVDYFRDRDEYVRRLVTKVPQIGITNGLYYTADRTAYFYDIPGQPNPDTLFHEATHQLFYENVENGATNRMIALDANFWIVEGIACYMESYRAENGQCVVGDPKHLRIEAARHRRLVDKYYVPLRDFAAMGMQQFQGSSQIAKNYSQAAGLAHFFMHYQEGRYRDALIEHLYEIYRANPRQRAVVQSLEQLTETPYAKLDRQYEEYMRSLRPGVTQADAAR